MRHPLLVLIVASASLMAPLAAARAQSADPSAVFLNAYMSVQQAEKLEREGSFKAALSKYRYAGSLLDQLRERNPEWQSLIVEYRKKRTADAIAKIEQKLALEAPPQPVPALPAEESAAFNPNLIPGVTDQPEGDLPQAAEPLQPMQPAQPAPPPPRRDELPTDVVEKAAREIRNQMATLKSQLQLSRRQLESVELEKSRIASQLEEAVQKLNQSGGLTLEETARLAKENEAAKAEAREATSQLAAVKAEMERIKGSAGPGEPAQEGDAASSQLKAELEQAKAEAARAKAQLEQAKLNESDLVLKLTDAEEELQEAKAGKGADSAIKKQIAKIQGALDDARADREIAEEQGAILARKMAALANRPDLSGKLAEAEEKAKAIAAENRKLTEAAAEADKKLADLTGQLDTERTQKTELSGQLTEAQKKLAELEEAERKLIAMTQERDAAKSQATELSTQLEERSRQVTALSTERDTLAKERDDALTELTKAREAKGEVEKLLAENADLMKKLDEAQGTIAAFNSAAPEKEKELGELKAKLGTVEAQLAAVQVENGNHLTVIEELQSQLDTTGMTADGEVITADQKKMVEENELLRGIVLRELKDQARREQARKLIFAELARLQVRSKALNDQVDLLSQPVVKLSEKERALFKAPQMEIIDNETNAMAFSIAAPQFQGKEENGASAAASDPAQAPPIDGPLPTGGDQVTPANNAFATSTSRSWNPKVETEIKPNLPPELQPIAQEAKEKLDRGQYLEAERAYEKLISKAPTNVYALSNLGVARFHAGKLKLAEETFKKAIALEPNDSLSYVTLGIVYYHQSRYDEAINALTRSIAVNPKNPMAHNYLGVTAAHKGWTEAAQKEIETALQIDPAYADAHFNLAVVLATAQPSDKETARKHYKKAMDLGVAPDPALENLIR